MAGSSISKVTFLGPFNSCKVAVCPGGICLIALRSRSEKINFSRVLSPWSVVARSQLRINCLFSRWAAASRKGRSMTACSGKVSTKRSCLPVSMKLIICSSAKIVANLVAPEPRLLMNFCCSGESWPSDPSRNNWILPRIEAAGLRKSWMIKYSSCLSSHILGGRSDNLGDLVQQLNWFKRFCQAIDTAFRDKCPHVGCGDTGSQADYRDILGFRLTFQLFKDLMPVHPGHENIQNNQGRLFFGRSFQSFEPVLCD